MTPEGSRFEPPSGMTNVPAAASAGSTGAHPDNTIESVRCWRESNPEPDGKTCQATQLSEDADHRTMEKPADPATLRFPRAGQHAIKLRPARPLRSAAGRRLTFFVSHLHAVDGVVDIGGGFEQEGVVADQSLLLAAGIFAASQRSGLRCPSRKTSVGHRWVSTSPAASQCIWRSAGAAARPPHGQCRHWRWARLSAPAPKCGGLDPHARDSA